MCFTAWRCCLTLAVTWLIVINGQQFIVPENHVHLLRNTHSWINPEKVEARINARYSTTATKRRPPLSTFTVTYSTSTSTSYATTVSICTTSTTDLPACSEVRRHRRMETRRGLFYNEDDYKNLSSGTPAQPIKKNNKNESSAVYITDSKGLMDAERQSRKVKLSFYVATFVLTLTTASILTLTATCATPTTFNLCGLEPSNPDVVYLEFEK